MPVSQGGIRAHSEAKLVFKYLHANKMFASQKCSKMPIFSVSNFSDCTKVFSDIVSLKSQL